MVAETGKCHISVNLAFGRLKCNDHHDSKATWSHSEFYGQRGMHNEILSQKMKKQINQPVSKYTNEIFEMTTEQL